MFIPLFAVAGGAAVAWLLNQKPASQQSQNTIVSGVPNSEVITLVVPPNGQSPKIPIPTDAAYITVYDSRKKAGASVFSQFAAFVLTTSNNKSFVALRGPDLLALHGRITVPMSVTSLTISNISPDPIGMYVTLIVERYRL